MMATAPSVDSPADVSASPDAQPVLSSSTRSDDSSPAAVNGFAGNDEFENKHITGVEDQVNSADVSVSGGSDTEASRGQKDGDKGQGRNVSSIKKPATFKAVSVNRNFLSKTAAPNATAKANDKLRTGTSTPPAISAAIPGGRPRLVAKAGSGARDSSPRFSSTANGGKPGAAPDPSAVWNKNRPVPPPDPKKFTDEELKKYGIHMASRLNEDDASGQGKWADIDDDDDDWAPEAITWGDGTKTAVPQFDDPPPPPPAPVVAAAPVATNGLSGLKLRLQEKSKSPVPSQPLSKPPGLPSGKGLVLKAATQEKPTLVAKPPPISSPAKSPWATLPPVDRLSPSATESNQVSSRGIAREPSPLKGAAAAVPPPKEIAADDFSRSGWREGGVHANRELFNSHSGRYEPVPDRRGSLARLDQQKHPALLQRQAATDQPAEPSSAFQTHRSSQDIPFSRRRGSSNVSGGSGSYYRLSKGPDGHIPPAEFNGARRPSMAGSLTSPIMSHITPASGNNQQRGTPQQSWAAHDSPAASFAATHETGPPGPAVGPPGPTSTVAQQPQAPPMQDQVEYQKQLMRERNDAARKRRQEEADAEEAAKKERLKKKMEAMGPAPPKKKSDQLDTSAGEAPSRPTQIQQREAKPSAPPALQAPAGQQDGGDAVQASTTSGVRDNRADAQSLPPSSQSSRRLSQGQETKPGVWNGPGPRPERLGSWNSGAPPPSRNVWGSPNNDRGLGNGTFNPDLGRIPGSVTQAPPSGPAPAPIAPPGRTQPPGAIGSRYNQAGSDLANKWVSAVADSDQHLMASRRADRVERDRLLRERGLTAEEAQPVINETWRPVHVPGDGTRRTTAPSEEQQVVHGQAHVGNDVVSGTQGSTQAPPPGVIGSGSVAMKPQTSQGSSARASRFFPARDIRYEEHNSGPILRPLSPSPPPPCMEGHPAYEGNARRPLVSLPKPHPVVKLPPSMTTAQTQQSRSTSFSWANPTPFRETPRTVAHHQQQHQQPREGERSQKVWQQKFNTLLNPTGRSPPKSAGVDPASKDALDHVAPQSSATVSLPGRSNVPAVSSTFDITTTKSMAEECFDEQEIGSLPRVKIPHKSPEAAWEPAEAQTKPLPKKLTIHASVKEPLYFPAEVVGSGMAMRILFPGMETARVTTLPMSASRGGRGGRGRGSRGRGRGAETKSTTRDDASSTQGESTPSTRSARGGRGSYRGRGSSNWNTQSQPQTSIHA